MNCYHCEKGVLFGRSHTHHRGVAGGRWKKRAVKTQRVFKPNLQPIMILIAGKQKKIQLCMRCLKRVKKDMIDGKKPFVQLAYPASNLVAAAAAAKEASKAQLTA